MSPLQFDGANAAVEASMKPELDRLAVLAATCPSIRIEVHGHSDASGPVQVNRSLAERRAQAAADYLVAAGVAPNRVSAIGHGARIPRVQTTADNGARNGRIEIIIRDPEMRAAVARVMWDLAELLDPAYVPVVARLSP